jgi:ParB-like chromosome segregation protein Spo0J
MTNISKDLLPLCLPIEKLVPLQNNPRKGNVDAIMSSYKEFGQIKPIVVRPEKDGTYLVIAGNHQLKAAMNLGWTKIAAVQMDVDEERAVAFALADNRTMELGHTDTAMLNDLVIDLWDEYPELFEGLGWDEFELAAIEESQLKSEEISPIADGYFTPVITNNPSPAPPAPTNIRIEESEDGERKIFANEDMDHNKVAISGSTIVSPGSAPQAVVQYTIVFDNPDQQRRWYDFVRYLRNDPGISGTTTAEKLIDFIDMHTEI